MDLTQYYFLVSAMNVLNDPTEQHARVSFLFRQVKSMDPEQPALKAQAERPASDTDQSIGSLCLI
jgi:hypothetical protein